jgi:hypothetical protein
MMEVRNEYLLYIRKDYIEIGKLVQSHSHDEYNGTLKIIMCQIECIDSDEEVKTKYEYLKDNFGKIFSSRGGLGDFIVYEEDKELRNDLNVKYNEAIERIKRNIENLAGGN